MFGISSQIEYLKKFLKSDFIEIYDTSMYNFNEFRKVKNKAIF